MGAMALLGEKYGDCVRVIKYGDSIELCGGTHVANTGAIGMIKIVSESSIAAGIRRIEAITGEQVEFLFDSVQDTILDIKTMLNNAPDAIVALRKSLADNAALHKQVEDFIGERIAHVKTLVKQNAQIINGINVLTLRGPFLADVVKGVVQNLRSEKPQNTILLAATVDAGRPMLTVMVSDDLVADGWNAGKMVREAAKHIQGGGGGQPGLAQAGGRNADGLMAAFSALMALIV